jgi:hypothetical protein
MVAVPRLWVTLMSHIWLQVLIVAHMALQPVPMAWQVC